MKNPITLLLAFILAFSLAACGGSGKNETASDTSGTTEATAEAKTANGDHSIADMDGLYKFQGRKIVNGKGLAMLSSADIFEFNADCSGKAAVKMYAETTEDSGDIDVYFTGYVDEVRCEERYHLDKDGEAEIVLAEDLEEGAHSFRLVRQTEWNHGDVYIAGVSVNGRLTDPPEEGKILIEFIGDSLTTGYGNLSDLPDDLASWGGAPVYQDATQAYPYKVGYSMIADISVVAIQGIGCACGYQDFTMNDVYLNYPRVYEKDYTFKPERQADVVVINLLANDSDNRKEAGLDKSQIVEKAVELVRTVRGIYPDAKIIFAPAAYDGLVKTAIEELGGEEAGYYITNIPMNFDGKDGHPSVAGHNSAMTSLMSTIGEISGAYDYTVVDG
ncbi:MAG: hypothetical protein IJT91_09060 [Clostridia bacterium]|nr:hypothetical protein [Clostridia bacterium]